MSREVIREQVILLLREGRLPRLPSESRVSGGRGDDSACYICGGVITPDEMQYDLEHTAAEKLRTLHLHLGCHKIWLESVGDRKIWEEPAIG
jgi:hypothetical protein